MAHDGNFTLNPIVVELILHTRESATRNHELVEFGLTRTKELDKSGDILNALEDYETQAVQLVYEALIDEATVAINGSGGSLDSVSTVYIEPGFGGFSGTSIRDTVKMFAEDCVFLTQISAVDVVRKFESYIDAIYDKFTEESN